MKKVTELCFRLKSQQYSICDLSRLITNLILRTDTLGWRSNSKQNHGFQTSIPDGPLESQNHCLIESELTQHGYFVVLL